MKVLYISLHETGGAYNSLKNILINIVRYNVTPIVLVREKNKLYNFCLNNNIEVYYYPYMPAMISFGHNIFKSIIKKIIYKYKYKFINNEALSYIDGKINWCDINIIHANVNRIGVSLFLGRKHNIPVVQHLREYGDLDYKCVNLVSKYSKYINDNASICIAISDAVRKHWIKKGIDNNKIKTIYNGIDVNSIIKRKNRISYKKINIVIAGLVTKSKGQFDIIKAISLLPKKYKNKVSLDIYGNCDRLYYLLIKIFLFFHKLNNIVSFYGYNENIYKKYCEYDIGMMCSKNEGFGLVTVEYMSAGLLPIVSNTGANLEIITDGENGFVYDKHSIKTLSNILLKIIENPGLIDKIGNNAKKSANSFSIDKTVDNIYKLYQQLLNY